MTPQEPEYIELTTRCGRKFRVGVESFARIKDFNWFIEKDREGRCYVVRNIYMPRDGGPRRTRRVRLARFLMGLERGDPRVVDHIDGDTMNNCLSNLRVCTVAENSRNQGMRRGNKIGFKGVSRHIRKDGSVGWAAYITLDRKRHNLGVYLSPEEAHESYCKAAKILHGEFANFGDRPASYEGASPNSNSWDSFTFGLRLRSLERRLVDLDQKRQGVVDQIVRIKQELAITTVEAVAI